MAQTSAIGFTTYHFNDTPSSSIQSSSGHAECISQAISPTLNRHQTELYKSKQEALPDTPDQVRADSGSQVQKFGVNRENSAADEAVSGESNWILAAGLLAASSSAKFFKKVFGGAETESLTDKNQNDPKNAPSATTTHIKPARSVISAKEAQSTEEILPSRKVADELVYLFFKRAPIHWIDRLKLMQWYEKLWTANDGGEGEKDCAENQIQHATLNIIFALVYQTEPDQISEYQDKLAHEYFRRAEKLLHHSLFDLNRLDLLFAFLLITQWFQSVNDVRQCTSTVRLCIMIAYNLGLHVPGKIMSLRNQRQREMALRAWHGCVLMDRITAMISGQPLQIPQDVASQIPLFEAIDDEYLSDSSLNGIQPAGKPSILSFYLAFCQLHLILGDILVHFHDCRREIRDNLDLNHIIEVDERLDQFYNTLPSHLRLEKDNKSFYAATGQSVHLYSRFLHIRIILYRVFFQHAAEKLNRSESISISRFADNVTHQGLLTCVRTAQEILELIIFSLTPGENESPRIAPQWWHSITYVFIAATVLIAAHLFPTITEEISTTSLENSIRKGFQILDHFGEEKNSAQRCKMALTVLYKRHVEPLHEMPSQSSNTSSPPNDSSCHISAQIDDNHVSSGFSWDLGDLSDLFRGESMESLLFNTNIFE
ncbi:hypothetical protein, variant [Verruconis gallopava]|nr:hypothetical protein, variant [Verruconis gallopava]KIW05791.1 hypothetical protein, variant [Verruconis gallopava]